MEWPLLILELAFQERRVSDYNLGGYNKLKIPHVNSRGSRARSARKTEPHTHEISSTSFRLVVT